MNTLNEYDDTATRQSRDGYVLPQFPGALPHDDRLGGFPVLDGVIYEKRSRYTVFHTSALCCSVVGKSTENTWKTT
jgi:hypothetical protein